MFPKVVVVDLNYVVCYKGFEDEDEVVGVIICSLLGGDFSELKREKVFEGNYHLIATEFMNIELLSNMNIILVFDYCVDGVWNIQFYAFDTSLSNINPFESIPNANRSHIIKWEEMFLIVYQSGNKLFATGYSNELSYPIIVDVEEFEVLDMNDVFCDDFDVSIFDDERGQIACYNNIAHSISFHFFYKDGLKITNLNENFLTIDGKNPLVSYKGNMSSLIAYSSYNSTALEEITFNFTLPSKLTKCNFDLAKKNEVISVSKKNLEAYDEVVDDSHILFIIKESKNGKFYQTGDNNRNKIKLFSQADIQDNEIKYVHIGDDDPSFSFVIFNGEIKSELFTCHPTIRGISEIMKYVLYASVSICVVLSVIAILLSIIFFVYKIVQKINDKEVKLVEKEYFIDIASIKDPNFNFEEIKMGRVIVDVETDLQVDVKIYRSIWKRNVFNFKVFHVEMPFEDDLEKYIQEIDVIKNYKHPSISRVYGYSIQLPMIGILFEYCPLTLHSYLHDKKDIKKALDDKLRILSEIIDGMTFLHEREIVHGNLTSKNIMITKLFRSRLCNFGVSICEGKFKEDDDVTKNVYSKAPELLQESATFDKKNDCFSFSFIIYEIMEEALPFKEEEDRSRIPLKMKNDPNYRPKTYFNSDIYESLKGLMKVLWSENLEERPSFLEIKNSFSLFYEKGENIDRIDLLQIEDDK